jgi:hypothetical protein
MSPPGRPKGEYRRPQAEGTPVRPAVPAAKLSAMSVDEAVRFHR